MLRLLKVAQCENEIESQSGLLKAAIFLPSVGHIGRQANPGFCGKRFSLIFDPSLLEAAPFKWN